MTTASITSVVGELVITKLHGLGNDFLVVLDDGYGPSAGTGPLDGARARRLCNRHHGIGADGLIVGTPVVTDTAPHLRFQLWNADGGEAEMSGNGIRCLAHAALDAGWVPDDRPF